MQKAYKAERFAAGDKRAIEELKIPGVVLMENAGRGACDEMLRRMPEAKKFTVLCGPGNNGGDGFVIARHLALRGRRVCVIASQPYEKYRGDAATNLEILRSLGCNVELSNALPDDEIAKILRYSDVVVDALLGTGTRGAPRGEVARLAALCEGCVDIVAVDMPTGVDGDTGEVEGMAIRARLTIAFSALKVGHVVTPGASHAGEVAVTDIGVSPSAVLSDACDAEVFDRGDLAALLPAVNADFHKGSRGSVLIVGGSAHYTGAPLLAARGALRAGCGLVVLAVPDFMAVAASSSLPEAIFEPLPTENGAIICGALPSLIAKWGEKCAATVIGPGLGRPLGGVLQDRAREAEGFAEFWNRCPGVLVADAGAFDFLCDRGRTFLKRDAVITPHAGEAARLLGTTPPEIMARRLDSSKWLSEAFGTVLLKGRHTIVQHGASVRVIREGSPVLAVAGSGDVLSGAVGAIAASGVSPFDAATAGTLLHAAAGSHLEAERGVSGALAHEIADEIAVVLHKLS